MWRIIRDLIATVLVVAILLGVSLALICAGTILEWMWHM